jgi:hypothetical protein
VVRFWDASAILPLLVPEYRTPAVVEVMRDDPAVAVWWATQVECATALARLDREGRLSEAARGVASRRLTGVANTWTEVPPLERVRDQAIRLVRIHPLRATDALQLAAAVVLSDYEPKALPFVTLDDRLAAAARREGFEVLGA